MVTFHQMPDRTGLGVAPEQVVAIIESINNPNISVPGAGTSPTKAYIVGIRLPNGNFTAMLYMHMLDLDTASIFAPDPRESSLEGYPTLEAEAIQFVESMGFMLDNMNFRARSAEEQHHLTQTLPIFFDHPPPRNGAGGGFGGGMPANEPPPGSEPPPAPPGEGGRLSPDESRALARLLAAF